MQQLTQQLKSGKLMTLKFLSPQIEKSKVFIRNNCSAISTVWHEKVTSLKLNRTIRK